MSQLWQRCSRGSEDAGRPLVCAPARSARRRACAVQLCSAAEGPPCPATHLLVLLPFEREAKAESAALAIAASAAGSCPVHTCRGVSAQGTA